MLKLKRKLNVLIALEIILTMTLYYFIFVGVTAVTYALDVVKTNHENIDYEAYFLNSNGEKVNKIEMTTDNEKQYLYVDISVHNEGYFYGSINLENNNFSIKPNKLSPEISEISENEVKLNQINAGSTVTLKLEIEPKFETKITEESLFSNTNVILKGQYINSKNVENEKYIDISGNSEVAINWKSSENNKTELDAKVLTNYIYSIQNKDKRIIQLLINSKLTNNNYPVKSTELNLNVPQNTENVQVHARSTKATNSNMEFTENNYIYSKEENKLTIKLSNEDNQNISWEKNCNDIIVVTYVLDSNSNFAENNLTVNDKIITYDNKEMKTNQTIDIAKDIDGIITTELNFDEKAIYKGKLYTSEDRDYTILDKVNIDYTNTNKAVIIKKEEASYLEGNEEKSSNIVYKQTKIDKNEFLKIFGPQGNITIKNDKGTIIANIDKNSETDENGKIIINYPAEEKSISLITSVPEKIGMLNIENTKTIKNTDYTRNNIEKLTGIKEKVWTNEIESETTIELKETESQADIKLDTNKISTLSDKQTITIDTTLLANNESQDLYNNPTVTIRLPKQIELISAQYAALYTNGLEVQDVNTCENEDRQVEINIKLKGEQLKYDTTGGTKIRFKLEVKTSKLTPSQKTQIEMLYTNENKNIQNNKNIALMLESQYGLMLYNKISGYNDKNENLETIDVEPVYGLLDVESGSREAKLQTALINNYEQEIQNIVLIGQVPSSNDKNKLNAVVSEIKTNNENAKIYYTVNKDANANDSSWKESNEGAVKYKIVIGQMDPEERLAIETTINIQKNSGYNIEGNFDTNVTYNVNNVEQKNSSRIVLKTENVNNDNSINEISNQNASNDINKKSLENENIKIDVNTTVGEDVLSDGADVKEGETVKYTIKITNNSGHDYSNINVKAIQKNGYVWDLVEKITKKHTSASEYTEVKTNWYEITDKNDINLGKVTTLKDGDSIEFSYKAVPYMLNNAKIDGTNTYGTIYLTSDDGSLNQQITTTKNIIKSAELQIILANTNNESYQWLEGGNCITSLVVKNLQNEDLSDVDMQVKLSSKLSEHIDIDSFRLSNMFLSFNEKDEEIIDDDNIILGETEKNENGEAIISFKIQNIKANNSIKMNMVLYAENINERKAEVWMTATAITAENSEKYSTKFERNIYKNHTNIDVNLNTLKQGAAIDENTKLNNDDVIKFIAKIENNDNSDTKINIEYELDETLKIQKAYIYGKETEDLVSQMSDTDLELHDLDLKSGESIAIVVEAKVDGINAEKITNTINVFDNNTGASYSKSVSFDVNTLNNYDDLDDSDKPDKPDKPDNPDNPDTPDNPDNPNNPDNSDDKNNSENKKYKITGVAWIDKNGDGRKDSEEKRIAKMNVSAIDTKTNNTVETTLTDSNGCYELNLSGGEYIIAFYYDNTIYKVTTYKAKGISENENSDAIDREFTVDGKSLTIGMTDIISLNNNLTDIDIGLINKSNFNLDIQKYVSKIIVQSGNETKTYEQKEGTTLAKAEIKAKYLKDSLVVIEYKIKVTNVGDIEGYAKNIEDVLPSSLTFKSSMNSDWYKSGSNLYNSSLANTPIKPGESKELTLTLTKTMTESNTGLINNKAKIEKSSNSQGIENQNNNMGSANVIISVSTGALVNYVTIVLIVFVAMGLLAYLFVKKLVIK